MRKRTKAREIALKILYAWEITSDPVDICREKYWEYDDNADSSVKAFADELVMGVVCRKEELDKTISSYATNWKLDRMATIDRNILRIAAFEMLYIDGIPPKVSMNEAIEMAKKYGDRESGKFVNGILDKINKTGKV